MTAVRQLAAITARCVSGPTISLLGRRSTTCVLLARTASRPLQFRQIHSTLQPAKDDSETTIDTHLEQDVERLDTSDTPADAPAEEETVPWFLRVEAPKVSHHPFAERQALPELPEDPPAELAELLNQLSMELGISDLELMDLRELNPPPAIGANTVMIFGTARSVRHLHATADKTCRWLRSTYKWKPYADGLLGRNELKLINRRKRRRGKVVSSQMGELEEAESAGWVCVHSGKGLVVQLFVESKRKEMDLEGLYQLAMERFDKRKEREIERWAKAAAEAEGRVYVKPGPSNEEIARALQEPTPWTPPVSGPITQKRSLHTSSFRMNMDPGFYTARSVVDPKDGDVNNSKPPKSQIIDEYPETLEEIVPVKLPTSETELKVKALLYDLMKNKWGADLLGKGFTDTTSTEFLCTFFSHMKSLNQFDRMTYYLRFLAVANQIKPRCYPFLVIRRFLAGKDCEASPLDIGNPWDFQHYYAMIAHNANSRPFTTYGIDKGNLREETATRVSLPAWRLHRIQSILQPMKERFPEGKVQKFMQTPEMRYIMSSIVSPSNTVPIRKAILAGDIGTAIRLLSRAPRPLSAEYYIYRTQPPRANGYAIKMHHFNELATFCGAHNWSDFWRSWKDLQIAGFRRDEEYYTLMIGLVAASKNIMAALKAARELAEEAAMEVPPVELEGMRARYLYDVLQFVETQAKDGSIYDLAVFKSLKIRLEKQLEKEEEQSHLNSGEVNVTQKDQAGEYRLLELAVRRTGLQIGDSMGAVS